MSSAAAAGCGSDLPDEPAAPAPCPLGQLQLTDGTCTPVGIQGCAEMFVEEDGVCRPTIDKCPAGTIPKFTEGCVPVGIQGCAAMFIEDDGLCHPSIEKCPGATIPKFNEGCVPVGIPDCAPEFLEDDGLCHPRMAKCPAGTFALPQKGCVPIDGPDGCGTGTWGNIADGPETIYVDPSYAGGDGDGSMQKPVTTIAEAQALVLDADRIALAAGIYDEGILIDRPLTLEGRCPSMVRLVGGVLVPELQYNATVSIEDTGSVAVRGIGIGEDGIGVFVSGSPDVTIERVHVLHASHTGVLAMGAATSVFISDSLIEGTLPRPDNLQMGHGVYVQNQAEATVQDCAVVGNRTGGLGADDAILLATGDLIAGTLPSESDKTKGWGVSAANGAAVELSASALADNHYLGLAATSNDTVATVYNNVIEGTLPQESNGDWGPGVSVHQGARADILANAVLGSHTIGVRVANVGSRATVAENLIRGTLAGLYDEGVGMTAQDGAVVTFDGNALVENILYGMYVGGDGTQATATRNLAEGTLPSVERGGGCGATIVSNSTATLDGNAIIDSGGAGIFVYEANTVTAAGNLIERTHTGVATMNFGISMTPTPEMRVTLNDNAILSNRDAAVIFYGQGGELTMSANFLRRATPNEDDPIFSNAVMIASGRATLTDNAIIASGAPGLYSANAEMMMTRNLIQATRPVADPNSFGEGVALLEGSSATLVENAILDNVHIGLLISHADVVASGNIIDETHPSSGIGYGVGCLCDNGTLSISSSIVRRSSTAGLLFADASGGEIVESVVEDVSSGAFLAATGLLVTGLGDGILSMKLNQPTAPSVAVIDTVTRRCARAGVLFESSSGSLSGVRSSDNEYGLVLQGSPWPSYEGAGNVFSPNRTQDILKGGDLPVPDGDLAVPEAPE